MRGIIAYVFIIILIAIFILFILGMSGNYKAAQNIVGFDAIGINTFFTAVKITFIQYITVGGLLVWSMIFFAIEGIFIFTYYKIARFIWVRIPEFKGWYERSKQWFK